MKLFFAHTSLGEKPFVSYNRRMDIIVDGTESQIAQRVKLERDLRNWSLAELAERSGVSKAMISKIEREEVSPTAAILARLAAAFELTLATLLLRAEGGPRLSRAVTQPVWRDPATGRPFARSPSSAYR